MNPTPFTITADAPLSQAAKLVHDNKLYGLCVVDKEGRLVGCTRFAGLRTASSHAILPLPMGMA